MKTKIGLLLAAGVMIVAGSAFAIQQYISWKGVAQRRAHAVQQLRDPDSVQFRAERLTSAGWLCGELNGKNAYGAYTGFKRFISLGEYDAWIEGSGYAGKPGDQPTAQILASIDAQIAVLKRHIEAKKKQPELPTLSEQEAAALAEQEMFAKRWKKHCS